MLTIQTRSAALITTMAAAVFAIGCGQSSTAELRLMDAPPEGVTSVKIWVASMQVHVDPDDKATMTLDDAAIDDDKKWHSLTVNAPIDLVQHQGETAAKVLGQLPLPLGKITQVRLVIDTTKPNTAVKNGIECALDTNKVAAKGIKINHVFKAFASKANALHQVWVDFKLDESLKATATCFELEPKLKLHKVKTDGKDELI